MSASGNGLEWRTAFRGTNKWIFLGACLIFGVTLFIYQPTLTAGFWSDDYGLVGMAARLSPIDYLVYYFDPRVQTIWYRPLQGMELGLAFVLFGSDPSGYHVIQVLLHALNCVLLFGLVTRVTRRWRIGLLAGLFYATLPTYSLAVYWATVAEPLLSVFSILTIWWWIDYLETGSRQWLVLSYLALVGALLTKEVAAALPVILFLADRMIVRKSVSLVELVKRYASFPFILVVYLLLEYRVITQGLYTRDSGYGIGAHVVNIGLQYLTRLTFPWGIDPPLSYVWLALVFGVFIYLALKRKWGLVFVAAAGILTMLPVMLFRVVMLRYMYLPLMATAVFYAVLGEFALRSITRLNRTRWIAGIAALAVAVLLWVNGQVVSDGGENYAGFVRETRLQFRPLFQNHPSLNQETFFYFVDPPFLSWNLNGLVTLRYGPQVTAGGLDYDTNAALRDHKIALVSYRDEQGTLREQPVVPDAAVRATPNLPAQFEKSISLSGYELVSNRVARGEAIILIIYWTNQKKLDKDYTVFAHLVDKTGKTVAGYDSQPKRGAAPTSTWQVTGRAVVDAVVVPIDSTAPIGDDYRLEVGWYDAATMQRLALLDANGQPAGDPVVFEPFSITP